MFANTQFRNTQRININNKKIKLNTNVKLTKPSDQKNNNYKIMNWDFRDVTINKGEKCYFYLKIKNNLDNLDRILTRIDQAPSF